MWLCRIFETSLVFSAEIEERMNTFTDTVECPMHIKILHENLRELRQNIDQMSDQQKTPHTSTYRTSNGTSFVNICEKIDLVIAALHCIFPTSSHLRG